MMLLTSKIREYFAGLYENTMTRAYQEANQRIAKSLISGGRCLDGGAASRRQFQILHKLAGLTAENYMGIELRCGMRSTFLRGQSSEMKFIRTHSGSWHHYRIVDRVA